MDVNANKKYERAYNHIVWYDMFGKAVVERESGGNDVAAAGVTGLAGIEAETSSAHHDTGIGLEAVLPDPRGTTDDTCEVVDRTGRMAVNAAVVSRVPVSELKNSGHRP